MPHIIDGCHIEENLILCRRSSPHLKTAGSIALRLHAWQQLYAAHDVRLAKQLWGRREVFQLQHLGTCLNILQSLTGRCRRDHHLVQTLTPDGVFLGDWLDQQ